LLLTTSLAPGGAETVVAQLAKALSSSGGEVRVVSMLPPVAFSDELETAGVKVISLGMKAGRPNLCGTLRLLSSVRDFQPDIIHGHMFHASILARLARILTGVPVVCTIHSEIECSHRKTSARFREWIYRLTDAACSRTTAVSERIRRRYVQERIVPSHRIEVIDNGVDPERFQPCPERRLRTRTALGWQDCFVWLAVGRLELAKDYPNLIAAFQKVREQYPFSKLAIAGDGRLRPQIEHLIQSTGLQAAVSLLGSRTDVPDLMNACDALVMCSAWEGGPLVLLEAGAAGRPVIATEVGAVPQIVLPGQTGLLVPPGEPAALAQAMTRLMMLEPKKLDQMGRNARRHIVDRFSLCSVHSRYMKLYEEVLAASA
jgi:glycosyltransferase involved in cell wall biosynthesis